MPCRPPKSNTEVDGRSPYLREESTSRPASVRDWACRVSTRKPSRSKTCKRLCGSDRPNSGQHWDTGVDGPGVKKSSSEVPRTTVVLILVNVRHVYRWTARQNNAITLQNRKTLLTHLKQLPLLTHHECSLLLMVLGGLSFVRTHCRTSLTLKHGTTTLTFYRVGTSFCRTPKEFFNFDPEGRLGRQGEDSHTGFLDFRPRPHVSTVSS